MRCAIGTAVLAAALSSCQPTEHRAGYWHELQSLPTPDGTERAVVYAVAYGGATVGYNYEVLVLAADETEYERNAWLWQSYRLPPISVEWLGANELRITVPRHMTHADMVKVRAGTDYLISMVYSN